MTEFIGYFCAAVLGFSVANAALGGGGRAAAWRVVCAVAGTLLVLVCALMVLFLGRGAVGSPDWVLIGVFVAVAVNGARVLGVFEWVRHSRRQAGLAGALMLVIGAGALYVARGGQDQAAALPLAGSASVGALPKDEKKLDGAARLAESAVASSAWTNSGNVQAAVSVPSVDRKIEGCPCGGVDLCEGPRGGRYCLTEAGVKRYKQ